MSGTGKSTSTGAGYGSALINYFVHIGVAVTLMAAAGSAGAAAGWPLVELPKDAVAFTVGEQLVVNGLPMRLQGFVSNAAPLEIASWFRQHMGKPLMENLVSGKLVLGQPAGEYFISIQLEAVGRGTTRGIVSVSHLKAGYEKRSETKSAMERLLRRLPPGSRLVSQMESRDRGRLGSHVVISNLLHEDLNRNRLTAMMRDDGLMLEQDALVDSDTANRLPASAANGRAMFFRGAGTQAAAVIFRNEKGQTTVILNIVTEIAHFK